MPENRAVGAVRQEVRLPSPVESPDDPHRLSFEAAYDARSVINTTAGGMPSRIGGPVVPRPGCT